MFTAVKTLPTSASLAVATLALAPLTGAAAQAECTADAGELAADPVAFNDARDTFFLSAFHPSDEVVGTIPNNFEKVFLLTSVATGADGADSLTVVAAAPDAYFAVAERGRYGIHAVVAETSDPAAPDFVNSEVLYPAGKPLAGVAATFDTLCGAVDVAGARLLVSTDTGLECADAIAVGTLTPEFTQVVAGGDSVAIRAARDEPAVVPGELELRYVLTRGSALVVVAVGEDPRFVVAAADTGVYTTHTFVAELSDPSAANYFDPATIVPGETTADDVANRYAQNGLCALLDGVGAQSFVGDLSMNPCPAEAGLLEASAKTINDAGDTATLRAARTEVAFLPEDYELLYVLTEGEDARVLAVAEVPSFAVDTAGEYRIHTLVAEVSDTTAERSLDLSVVEFGVTTADDVAAAAQAASACYDLDLVGAAFTVAEGELTTVSVRAAPAAAAGLRVWRRADGQVGVRFAPTAALGDRAAVTLRDGLGRAVARATATGLVVGAPRELILDAPSAAGGFYVLAVEGARARSARGVVLR